jgi:hypothetical protein
LISAEELEVMVSNIYNNTVNRQIYGGRFFINPVVTPAPETQQKLDILENQYNWDIRFNDERYTSRIFLKPADPDQLLQMRAERNGFENRFSNHEKS